MKLGVLSLLVAFAAATATTGLASNLKDTEATVATFPECAVGHVTLQCLMPLLTVEATMSCLGVECRLPVAGCKDLYL
jgi:hypothetical protein